MPKLILIDGNSLLYRAFFAMRYLSTSSGQPTNAIYGLTQMLLKVLEEKPDYVAAAFDTPKPTFRHEEYDGYKAQRKPPPDSLVLQQPLARDLIRAFRVPVVEVPGYEADDIIGAMARVAERQGIDTMIITGDLDTLQLIDEHTRVMTTQKGVTDTVIYDAEAVRERFGLGPDQMIDFKGLKGDPSDNIPGVPGIGEKTAADLLKRFGTIENLLEHLSDLPEGKVRRTLEENRELAILSKRLSTIVCDIPGQSFDLEDYRFQEPDHDELRDMFVRLEFKTIMKRLPEVIAAEGKKAPEERVVLGACRQIQSQAELASLIQSIQQAGECSIQVHTADSKSIRAELLGISFCTEVGEAAYVEVIDPARENSVGLAFDSDFRASLTDLAPVLASDRIAKSCHDLKHNYAALMSRKVQLAGVNFDTMLASYLLDASRSTYAIADLAFERLSLELPGEFAGSEAGEPCGEACAAMPTRICAEAEAIFRLKPVLESKLSEQNLDRLFYDVELPLAPILAEMELTGVAVDVQQLNALSVELASQIAAAEDSVYKLAGEKFNIGSTKQLQSVLFEKLGLVAGKKTKTGYSTSAGALEEMAADNAIVSEILRWRELTKIKSTYADSLPKLINPATGRIHTSLNQAVTATGRLSSSDPNLQNIPIRNELGRGIRRAFVASGDNVLVSADYSQIELRILAHITNDEKLISAFEADEDIHQATACVIFGCEPADVTSEMRRRAKTVNFAVIYGMADFTLGRQLGISTHEAREYIATYFSKMPGVRTYTEETINMAREKGYVSTLFGRRRYVQDIHNANYNIRLAAERAAVNMPIQGTAADLMKMAMIKVHDALRSVGGGFQIPPQHSLEPQQGKMLLQVHDELLFECPPTEATTVAAIAQECMSSVHPMRVPLKVDVKVGRNWAEMTSVPTIA